MLISDWSSDVCSSDLSAFGSPSPSVSAERIDSSTFSGFVVVGSKATSGSLRFTVSSTTGTVMRKMMSNTSMMRSEEHTSELQSLMRLSYAVFCLKNKNKQQHTSHTPQLPNNMHAQQK